MSGPYREQDQESDPEFARLKEDYVASLGGRKTALEAALGSKTVQEVRQRVQEIAHKLAGSAASYGFRALGEVASRLDDAIDGAPDLDGGKLERLTRELIAEVDRALIFSAGPRSSGATSGSS